MRLLAGALALCATFQCAAAQCADLDASGQIGVEVCDTHLTLVPSRTHSLGGYGIVGKTLRDSGATR